MDLAPRLKLGVGRNKTSILLNGIPNNFIEPAARSINQLINLDIAHVNQVVGLLN